MHSHPLKHDLCPFTGLNCDRSTLVSNTTQMNPCFNRLKFLQSFFLKQLNIVNNHHTCSSPLIRAYNKSLWGSSLGLIVVFQPQWKKIWIRFQCLLSLTRGTAKCCQVWVNPHPQWPKGHLAIMENGMLGTSILHCQRAPSGSWYQPAPPLLAVTH